MVFVFISLAAWRCTVLYKISNAWKKLMFTIQKNNLFIFASSIEIDHVERYRHARLKQVLLNCIIYFNFTQSKIQCKMIMVLVSPSCWKDNAYFVHKNFCNLKFVAWYGFPFTLLCLMSWLPPPRLSLPPPTWSVIHFKYKYSCHHYHENTYNVWYCSFGKLNQRCLPDCRSKNK